jgi:hypothetical protein
MTENTEAKVSVRADREKYVPTRSASGAKSLSNGDFVATLIQGMEVDDCHRIAKKFLGESTKEKYGHLNVGMQRMNVGNRLRGKVAAIDADNAKVLAKLKEGEKAPDQVSGEDQLVEIAQPFRDKTDQALAKAAEAKAKADAEKAKEKEAKAKAKAEKDAAKAKATEEKAAAAKGDKK